jgi:hypothetical protein
MVYMITAKGRAVLRSPALWGLSGHLRDLLALCDPAVRLDHAGQFMPPGSLQAAVFSLQQLELIEGPPARVPGAAAAGSGPRPAVSPGAGTAPASLRS